MLFDLNICAVGNSSIYIKKFKCIINYLYLASNNNLYYLVVDDESCDDIDKINTNLFINKKNPEFDRNNLIFLYTNENQINWFKKFNFKYDNYNYHIDKINDINKNKYKPSIIERVPWAYNNYAILNDYYHDDNIKIFLIEGFEHHWDIIKYFTNNIYIFVQISFYNVTHFETALDTLYTLNKDYNPKNIIWQCPDLEMILLATYYGFNSILCNHNCWLDYNIYKINDEPKIYDLVVNSRPEKWKRPYLANKVENFAFIKGHVFEHDQIIDVSTINYKYINDKWLSIYEVVSILNKARCGGIFSALEGACYSSSEYLLCGLPVISTISKGGRDTWYTPYNSIIVEDNEDSVKKAVDICISKLNNNEFNPIKIREDHINLTSLMRNNFNEYVHYLFKKHDIKFDNGGYGYFNQPNKYFNKMINCINLDLAIKLIIE